MEIVLPSYTFVGYNAHCCKISPDRVRYDIPSVAQIVTKEWLEDSDGDMVMPQVVVTENKEEEYIQVRVEVTGAGPVAHTPVPSAGLHTDRTDCLMTVMHTPFLGTMCTLDTLADRQTDDMKSRAGMNIRRYKGNIQSQGYDTDMRNLQQSHGSLKLNIQIKLNKTPTVVGAS